MAYQRNTNFYVPTLATPKVDPAKVATFNSIGNWVDPNRKAQIASAGLSQEQQDVNRLGQQANADPDHRYGIIEGINKLQEKQNQDLASLQPELRKLSEQNIRQEADKITQAYGQGGEGANSFGNQYAASVRGNNNKSIDMARAGNVVIPAGDALEKFGSVGLPMSEKLTHALADSDYNHTFEYHPDSVNASMAGYSGTSMGDGTGGAAPGQTVGGEDQRREGWGSTFMPGGEYDRGGGADAQWKYKHDYDVNGKYVGNQQPTGYRGASPEYLNNIKSWSKQPNNLWVDQTGKLARMNYDPSGSGMIDSVSTRKGDTYTQRDNPDGKYTNWNWIRDQQKNKPVVAQAPAAARPPQPYGMQFAKSSNPSDWITKLDPKAEASYQKWAKGVGQDPNGKDYDLRGYYKDIVSKGQNQQALNPSDNKMHFPDTYKTPLHESFSGESRYADPKKNPPAWAGNDKEGWKLTGKDGKVYKDESVKQPESMTPPAMTQNEDGTWSSYGGNRDLKQMSRADKLNEILENGGGALLKSGQDVMKLHDTALDDVIRELRGQAGKEDRNVLQSGFYLPQQGELDTSLEKSPLAGVIDPPGAYTDWVPPKEGYKPGEVMYGAPKEKMSGIKNGYTAGAQAPAAAIAPAPAVKLVPKPMLAGAHPNNDIFSQSLLGGAHPTYEQPAKIYPPLPGMKPTGGDYKPSGMGFEDGQIQQILEGHKAPGDALAPYTPDAPPLPPPPQTPEHRAVVNGYKILKQKNPPMAQFLTKLFAT